MLDTIGMDRQEIKYELFSSVCSVRKGLFTAFINLNSTHTDTIPICTQVYELKHKIKGYNKNCTPIHS